MKGSFVDGLNPAWRLGDGEFELRQSPVFFPACNPTLLLHEARWKEKFYLVTHESPRPRAFAVISPVPIGLSRDILPGILNWKVVIYSKVLGVGESYF